MVFFENGQGIHIGTQSNQPFLRVAPFDAGHNAGAGNTLLKRNAHKLQLGANVFSGLVLLHRQFRVGMQMPANLFYFIEIFPGKALNVFSDLHLQNI